MIKVDILLIKTFGCTSVITFWIKIALISKHKKNMFYILLHTSFLADQNYWGFLGLVRLGAIEWEGITKAAFGENTKGG